VVAPLAKKPTPGKTVDFVACGLPVCLSFGASVQSAATSVGWHYKLLNAGLTPQTISAAFDQAVRDKPAGVIVAGGTPPSLFGRQLNELKADNIPVVSTSIATTQPGIPWVAIGGAWEAQAGTDAGNYILSDSGGKDANVAIVTTPSTPVYSYAHATLDKVINSSACSGCSTSTFSFPETDIGTTLPGDIISYLRAHSNINYVFSDFANELDGLPTALKNAGLSGKVKLVTTDTGSTESAYIKEGAEAAAIDVPWPEALWNAFDVVLRVDAGESVTPAANIKLPAMILTQSDLPAQATQGIFPLVSDYETAFKKAWHVS
jgi:ABC-type sugar transport system substrate-binding protein